MLPLGHFPGERSNVAEGKVKGELSNHRVCGKDGLARRGKASKVGTLKKVDDLESLTIEMNLKTVCPG